VRQPAATTGPNFAVMSSMVAVLPGVRAIDTITRSSRAINSANCVTSCVVNASAQASRCRGSDFGAHT
jgi:hypothetical protein